MEALITQTHRILHQMRSGIGASWHAIEEPVQGHGGSAWGANPRPEDESAWQSIYKHASWLGMTFSRVEIEQRMYQPQQDRFTFDGFEMRVLYRILDWCERNGADVLLQQMWSNVRWNAHTELLGSPNSVLKSSPKNLEAFADGIIALVHHLVRIKGYTCIKYLCLNNEPGHSWSWYQDKNMDPQSITPALRLVAQKLQENNLEVALTGPDWTDLPPLDKNLIDFSTYIDAYDIHSYNANFDWRKDGFLSSDWPLGGYPMQTAIDRLAEWVHFAHEQGKPFLLSEMGSMQFGWGGDHPGPGKFDAGLKDVQMIIRGMNIGIDAFNRWSFNNRGNLDGQWQLIDTWDAENITLLNTFQPHPNVFYLYGLISRLTPKAPSIFECQVKGGHDGDYQRLFAACNGNEKVTNLLVTNDSYEEIDVKIHLNEQLAPTFFLYELNESEHADQVFVDTTPTKVEIVDGVLQVGVKPKSLYVLSSQYLKHHSPSPIIE